MIPMPNERIIIVGPGGSGKDFLAQRLIPHGYSKAVSCTTRPMRPGEEDGKTYHFIAEDEFRKRIAGNEFKEWYAFGTDNWLYGTRLVDFNSATLFVMSPAGLRALSEAERAGFVVVYLDIPEDVRMKRLDARGDADSTERRLLADCADFKDFDMFDIRVTSPKFHIGDVLTMLEKFHRERRTE